MKEKQKPFKHKREMIAQQDYFVIEVGGALATITDGQKAKLKEMVKTSAIFDTLIVSTEGVSRVLSVAADKKSLYVALGTTGAATKVTIEA